MSDSGGAGGSVFPSNWSSLLSFITSSRRNANHNANHTNHKKKISTTKSQSAVDQAPLPSLYNSEAYRSLHQRHLFCQFCAPPRFLALLACHGGTLPLMLVLSTVQGQGQAHFVGEWNEPALTSGYVVPGGESHPLRVSIGAHHEGPAPLRPVRHHVR